jgi:protein-disulfide isomerase
MERSRLRDFTLGFLFCAAIAFSYHCGKSDSSNLQAVAAQATEEKIAIFVVDTNTGRITASELVDDGAIGTAGDRYINGDERYW